MSISDGQHLGPGFDGLAVTTKEQYIYPAVSALQQKVHEETEDAIKKAVSQLQTVFSSDGRDPVRYSNRVTAFVVSVVFVDLHYQAPGDCCGCAVTIWEPFHCLFKKA